MVDNDARGPFYQFPRMLPFLTENDNIDESMAELGLPSTRPTPQQKEMREKMDHLLEKDIYVDKSIRFTFEPETTLTIGEDNDGIFTVQKTKPSLHYPNALNTITRRVDKIDQIVEEQIELQKRAAKIKLMGPRSEEDVQFMLGVVRGDIVMVPLSNKRSKYRKGPFNNKEGQNRYHFLRESLAASHRFKPMDDEHGNSNAKSPMDLHKAFAYQLDNMLKPITGLD